MPSQFSSGKHAIAECDRCGYRYKLKELRKLVIKTKNVNILVCNECWEPDQPQLQLGLYPVNDPQAVRNPRPDTSYYAPGNNGAGGSRVTEWGWNPVGGSRSFDAALTPNSLVGKGETGSVTIGAVPPPTTGLYLITGSYTYFYLDTQFVYGVVYNSPNIPSNVGLSIPTPPVAAGLGDIPVLGIYNAQDNGGFYAARLEVGVPGYAFPITGKMTLIEPVSGTQTDFIFGDGGYFAVSGGSGYEWYTPFPWGLSTGEYIAVFTT